MRSEAVGSGGGGQSEGGYLVSFFEREGVRLVSYVIVIVRD